MVGTSAVAADHPQEGAAGILIVDLPLQIPELAGFWWFTMAPPEYWVYKNKIKIGRFLGCSVTIASLTGNKLNLEHAPALPRKPCKASDVRSRQWSVVLEY